MNVFRTQEKHQTHHVHNQREVIIVTLHGVKAPPVSCNGLAIIWIDASLMPLFHWPPMPLRSYGVRKYEHIRSKIAEMVWWNISGATISHVLRFNCVSMANGWRTCGAYGAWMAMPLLMVLRMRTWILRIHGTSGVCIAYIPRTRCDQLDSTAYGGRMCSAWAVYTCRTYKYISFYSCGNVNVIFKCTVEHLNVQFNLANLISHVNHRNDIILITVRMTGYL